MKQIDDAIEDRDPSSAPKAPQPITDDNMGAEWRHFPIDPKQRSLIGR
jgi:hypothetical protein